MPVHSSVQRLWEAYCTRPDTEAAPGDPRPDAWHFCDNKAEANELAALVLDGIKQATSPSLWELQAQGIPVPQPGDLNIVTDWDGVAQCIIQTTAVDICPFDEVPAAHAAHEGEGDGTLDYWRRTHWAYYSRILADTPYTPQRDMPVVCERFRVVHRLKSE